jgi:hypothetical protein
MQKIKNSTLAGAGAGAIEVLIMQVFLFFHSYNDMVDLGLLVAYGCD